MQVVLNLKDFENDYFSVFLKGRLKRVVGRIALKNVLNDNIVQNS